MFEDQFVKSLPPYPFETSLDVNTRIQMDGLDLLNQLPDGAMPCVFFDPQYRGVLDAMRYGNEGKGRGRERSELTQMSELLITEFLLQIGRVLCPSGYLFLWMDKFHLCEHSFGTWIKNTELNVVDLITWYKGGLGMGYRTRRACEYLLILQKSPTRAKGTWGIRNIPDVWYEKVRPKTHPHQKPFKLQAKLIEAVTDKGDYVVDPSAGSFSVMNAAHSKQRHFIGCDLRGE